MKRYGTVIAVAATIAIGLQLPACVDSFRLFRADPMNARDDLARLPAGAAISFRRKGKTWFHLPVGGDGYMKIDGKLRKFRRILPAGDSWACEPMVFVREADKAPKDIKPGGMARIYKQGGNWTVIYVIAGERSVVSGLTCSSGD